MSQTRGSQFSRVIRYFREADVIEAEACLLASTRTLAERKRAVPKGNATGAKRGRKANSPIPHETGGESLSDA